MRYPCNPRNETLTIPPQLQGRALSISSRSDGKAWEDVPPETERDPVLSAFREARVQVQVACPPSSAFRLGSK